MHSPALASPLNLNRRTLLRSLFLGLGAAAIPAWVPGRAFGAGGGPELDLPSGPLANIGPVVKQTLTSGAIAGVDDLVFAPEGFSVRCVARAGLNPVTGMASGFTWHINPDGGAVFPNKTDGGWAYTSNSETTPGGAGAIRFAADGTVVGAYRILDGTRNNCAGGATPWGTWLSCEETTGGFVYECNPFGTAAEAVQKPALGGFPHEAVAIDPINSVAYLTEDGGDQRFYRFVSSPADITTMADGTKRMGLTTGTLQVLKIEGFAHNTKPTEAQLRNAVRCTWVAKEQIPTMPPLPMPSVLSGSIFTGGEGVWYHEIPEALRTTPALGTKPTRGVIFFATKGDNRVFAFDIENQLLELIFDNANMQITTGFDDVDNVTVSPAGDVLVAEDGNAMRLYVIVPNKPAKLLMQITKGGSEICGPAFTPDGSRLYFSSQRGPSGAAGTGSSGATYELTIPEQFRSLAPKLPAAFTFIERTNVALSTFITSEALKLTGFTGSLPVSISSGGQYRINNGAWMTAAGNIAVGDTLDLRHVSAAAKNTATESIITVGGYSTVFRSITATADRVPDAFNFTTITGATPGELVESAAMLLSGFDAAAAVVAGAGQEYRIGEGPWTRASGQLMPGQTLQVRHTASSSSLGYSKSTLKVGGVSGSFTSRTRK